MEQVVIVGITGRAGAGKDTVAKYLEATEGFIPVAFGAGIREALRAMDGADWRITKRMGMTPRRAMQVLGTECGRSVDPLIWTKLLAAKVQFLFEHWVELGGCPTQRTLRIVVPDVRFDNEAVALRVLAGRLGKLIDGDACFIVRIIRDAECELSAEEAGHASETSVDGVEADDEFLNDGLRDVVCSTVWSAMSRYFSHRCSTWNR